MPTMYKIINAKDFIKSKPNGVGPMTITMLLYNTVRSAEKSLKEAGT